MLSIAPRVVVYPHGVPPPLVQEGWLALAQLGPVPMVLSAASLRTPALPGGAGAPATPQGHTVFGDGSHPTTRLCASAVDLICRRRAGIEVLDVGTGTGILARIARGRGARFVVGTDIAPAAIACAKAHAELDALGLPVGATANFDADGLPVESATGHGEPMAECGAVAGPNAMTCTGARSANIHFGDEAPDRWGARFDLVVANILEAPLHGLAPALSRALVPGGVLLISGFTRPQAPALRLAYETTGLKSAGDFSLDDWVLLKFRADQSFSAM